MGDHTESLQIDFNPREVSYEDLLDLFWSSHQPASESYSRQYMAAVFYANEQQKNAIEQSRVRLESRSGQKVRTLIAPLRRFYRAEDYHQKYSLRKQALLMREFQRYSPHEFVDSTVAARLNGYVGHQGDRARLNEEVDSFGLSASARATLTNMV